MHHLSVFNYVAGELGHDEPVLHAVVATHRYLPPDLPEEDFMATLPHIVTASSCRPSSSGGPAGADVSMVSTAVVAGEDALAAPKEVALTVEQELAKLSEKLAAWKVRRLADLQAPGGIHTGSRLSQMEAEMKQRLARRRMDEQNRAQKRMEVLLTSLGPRIEKQLQLMTREFISGQVPASDSARAAATSNVNDSPSAGKVATAAATTSPPSPRARILCDQEYYVALQKIALEERDARQSLRRHMWIAHHLTHLVADEASFRRCIETREGVWREQLDEESRAYVEADRF
ncbi:hypothetical protein LSCM4_02356 [Leishmania orientalis]|uniref:Uncharacterized protein n=1 Tax=Leishmania orientalis TaxID=2249476 RepID=A0A836GS58_9TRYP|nr:hypothetical protein LSCM4_02356 [Leishmania orientalis]